MGRRGERAVAGRERAGKRSADAVRVPATRGNGEGEVGNCWVEINGMKGRSSSGATDLEEVPSPAPRCVLAGVWLRFVTRDVSCRPMGCSGGARVGGERLCCFLGTSGLCSRAPSAAGVGQAPSPADCPSPGPRSAHCQRSIWAQASVKVKVKNEHTYEK